jgi:hypothetical protein
MNRIRNRLNNVKIANVIEAALTDEDKQFVADAKEQYGISDKVASVIENAIRLQYTYDQIKSLFLEPSAIDEAKAQDVLNWANAFKDIISEDALGFVIDNARKLPADKIEALTEAATDIAKAGYDKKVVDCIANAETATDVINLAKQYAEKPDVFKNAYHLAKLLKRNKIAKRMFNAMMKMA